jgi:hypothetical protein
MNVKEINRCLILHLNYFGVTSNRTAEWWTRHSAEYTYEFDGAGFPSKRTCKDISTMSSRVLVWIEEFTYITKAACDSGI